MTEYFREVEVVGADELADRQVTVCDRHLPYPIRYFVLEGGSGNLTTRQRYAGATFDLPEPIRADVLVTELSPEDACQCRCGAHATWHLKLLEIVR